MVKVATHWLLSLYRETKKLTKTYILPHKTQPNYSPPSNYLHIINSSSQNLSKFCHQNRESQALISDFSGTLLKPTASHLFPYFMLVAFEGGSLIRALLLLLSSPFLCLLGYTSELSVKIMIFITFCGLRVKKMELVGRAVMPKFYHENLNVQACQVLSSVGKRVVISRSLPRVMVEGFLKEYLDVSEVLGVELQVVKGGFFSGLIESWPGLDLKQRVLKDLFGESKADVGLVSSYNSYDHVFSSYCKKVYVVSKENNSTLPKNKYPKPLIFHDSRLAFLPTPLSALSLFLFLPFSIFLALFRAFLGLLSPYSLVFFFAALTGVRFHVHNHHQYTCPTKTPKKGDQKGALYVCTHRTLLDPVMLLGALQRPIPAVTYSLSRLSEALSPLRTVRLSRDRNADCDTMLRLLKEGDLAICPEGTTCREPYLLRFSPLFAELTDEIVPVAMDAKEGWFYGTTASGLKCLDLFFFFMNPMPGYQVEFLDRVAKEMTCVGGGRSGSEVANRIQKLLGDALGFECTQDLASFKWLHSRCVVHQARCVVHQARCVVHQATVFLEAPHVKIIAEFLFNATKVIHGNLQNSEYAE